MTHRSPRTESIPRRTFLGALGAMAAAGAVNPQQNSTQEDPVVEQTPIEPAWPGGAYRRFSVDIHVPDWDPALLSRFNGAEFVETLASGGVQSHLQYTNSHVGLCLWKTKIGKPHAAMQDRDFFGEVVTECRKRGIHPLAYFSLIHDNWAFEFHEDWRFHFADGSVPTGRYGFVCFNSPYRDYVLACIAEICGGYDIVGMFFDMTFWPGVCYCRHCAARFQLEQVQPLPRLVDWMDPAWRTFQRSRQDWLLEFATTCTSAAKTARPTVTVNHQFSTIFHNWTLGVPLELTEACDYVGGDFYGGPIQHSLACKLYHGLTRHRPFEFHTSRTRIFTDHVTVKPMEEIRTESFVATLHSAALMIVDYINADGTLNREAHEFLGRLSVERAKFEPFLGGDLLADVAIYVDKNSMYNPFENGVDVQKLAAVDACPHRTTVVGAARVLQEAHIPFGVVTNVNLNQLSRYRAVILPWVVEMTAPQAELFRRFVAEGGALYASGPSSVERLMDPAPRFLLEDVLGVRITGVKNHPIFYLTPEDPAVKTSAWPQDHVSHRGTQVQVEVLPGCEILARITMPFVDPGIGRNIGSHFAAIHSNPPSLTAGTEAAVVQHPFGKGRVVWVACGVEGSEEWVDRQLVLSLLRRILPGPYHFEVEAHPAVEMTLFCQPERNRLLASLLNLQRQLPQVPVPATVRVQPLPGQPVRSIKRLPEQTPVPFTAKEPYVEFHVDPFDTLAMFAIDYD
ncbi:MAG: alpha-L-fucosidase [Pirellulaceae bacterium]